MTKTFLISGSEVSFIPGTYAMFKTLEKFDLNVDQLFVVFEKQHKLLGFISSFAFFSYESWCLKNQQLVKYNESDIFNWIDENGGWTGKLFTDLRDMTYESLGIKIGAEENKKATQTDKKKD